MRLLESNVISHVSVCSRGGVPCDHETSLNRTLHTTPREDIWWLETGGTRLLLARLESAYSLIWGSHKIWGKGGGDTLDLL